MAERPAYSGVIVSIQIGKPVKAKHGSKEVNTAIFKLPADGPHHLHKEGLPGDGQADLVHHGGPDKAVCVYFGDHYPHWEDALGKQLGYGAFGENFTIAGGNETEISIGDIFQAGDARVQVTQPRLPCFKLGMKHNEPKLPDWVLQTGYTGFYLRVLEEGQVNTGDRLELVERHPARITIMEATTIMMKDKDNLEAARRLAAVEELSESWREPLMKRIEELTAPRGVNQQ
ncbi:MOSC domain-containing protein [Paenibacillus tarimensis]